MKDHFKRLWNYNDWANKKVLESLMDFGAVKDKKVALMSHVLSAQFIWYLRIVNKPTMAFPVWEKYKMSELFTMNEDSTMQWQGLLEKEINFNKEISYTNTIGEKHTSRIEEIFTHVINHGTHHRAQIAALLRAAGQQPPTLDYIFYSRL